MLQQSQIVLSGACGFINSNAAPLVPLVARFALQAVILVILKFIRFKNRLVSRGEVTSLKPLNPTKPSEHKISKI